MLEEQQTKFTATDFIQALPVIRSHDLPKSAKMKQDCFIGFDGKPNQAFY
jgi:hypothetical protein